MLTLFLFFYHTLPAADQKSSEIGGAKSATDVSDTLPADVCVRMVSGRVREILDLLARSDNDMGCADAYWLQKLLKSVIRALDDLRSACCGPRQVNITIFSLVCFVYGPLASEATLNDRLKLKSIRHIDVCIISSKSVRLSKLRFILSLMSIN